MSKILVIEDNETMREGMSQMLKRMGHDVTAASGGTEGLKIFKGEKFDLVITDYKMEGLNGIEVIEKLKAIDPDIDVILITAYGTVDIIMDAVKKGASDYITKPFSTTEFNIRVEKVLRLRQAIQDKQRLDEENKYLRNEIEIQYNFGEIVGSSPKMKAVFDIMRKIAKSDSSVIIYGESGTGKELVARAIHNQSDRRDRPFIKVNCGALAEGVLESELFGHEKGSFTGAIRRKLGRFELANHGTIFLDEVGDIPLATQVKLLRVIQEREFERVGGEQTLTVDVRVIAATNKNLAAMVKNGTFREDLFYRLHVIPIELPPLRERKEDIPMLVEHFLRKKSAQMNRTPPKISDSAMNELMKYNFPGNVRELENIIERAIVLCENDLIGVNDLPILFTEYNKSEIKLADEDMTLIEAREELERQLILRALEKAKGIKAEAARILGLKPSALYYKLEKYGLI